MNEKKYIEAVNNGIERPCYKCYKKKAAHSNTMQADNEIEVLSPYCINCEKVWNRINIFIYLVFFSIYLYGVYWLLKWTWKLVFN